MIDSELCISDSIKKIDKNEKIHQAILDAVRLGLSVSLAYGLDGDAQAGEQVAAEEACYCYQRIWLYGAGRITFPAE